MQESIERGEDWSEGGVCWDRSNDICRRSDGGSAASLEKSESAKIAGEGVGRRDVYERYGDPKHRLRPGQSMRR